MSQKVMGTLQGDAQDILQDIVGISKLQFVYRVLEDMLQEYYGVYWAFIVMLMI